MANTYTLISSVTVGSGGAASMGFTSIPATYTDLLIKTSARGTSAHIANDIILSFNGSSADFTGKLLYGSGSSAVSGNAGNAIGLYVGANATASTFSNGEYYIPNYTSSNFKSTSADDVSENNATTAYQYLIASLWSQTAAITSITLTPTSGNFVQYSTAYLYGISNA
jgi:hypothetical protein